MVTSFSGGGSRSTRKKPPTMGKQLVNFITCGCESSVPFFVINKANSLSRTAASSTAKTGHHDKAEILLKLVLKHQKSINQSNLTVCLLDMICKYIVYHTLAE
jgi:hypothetical protein